MADQIQETARDHSLDKTSIRVGLKKHAVCDHDQQPLAVRRIKRTRRIPARTREMRFASLHHHTTYSYLDGYALPEAHVRRATELGMTAMAVTEHGNVSSHVKFELEARKVGVKPIFGVELYCGPVDEEHRQQLKNHLTILAEDQLGYRNLLALVSRTFSDGFYYEPTASGQMLESHKDGIVVLSGCQSSLLCTSLIGGKGIAPDESGYRRGLDVARRFKRAFGDAYYLEVQAFPELADTRRINEQIRRISSALKIPMVASMDCHYTVPEEKELQQILHNVRGGGKQTLEEQTRSWGYKADLCPPMNDNAMMRRLIATGLSKQEAIRAILTTGEIAERCTVEVPSLPMLRYPLPSSVGSSTELWHSWLERGWKYRGLHRLPKDQQQQYRDRLNYECGIIEGKDFIDYFLVVSDAVRWAKDHDIAVGPARGSAAGSLACWLLRITEVNPMLYADLVFERFIDVTREDLPDIDLDFDSDRRSEVRDYLVSKYGRECVNNVGTFSTYKAKLALDDTARVFKVPIWQVSKIKDVLIERSSGDLRASATIEDTAEQFEAARAVFEEFPDLGIAMDLEGNVKGFGVHAAGLVVSAGDIREVCAVYERVVKGELVDVVSLDKYDAERKGLLKLDFLGLKNMTILNNCRLEMGWSLDDLYNIDLTDAVTLAGFRRNDVTGIFQYDGRASRYVNAALQPESFKEVCDVTALARPGPLHNGAANEYIDIKMGRRQPDLLHPALEPILASTHYQVVYQEQILRILGEVGGFPHTHRAEVRRIISRKIGEQAFNRRWQQFYDGAKKLHGMDEETARAIWGQCITAGSYAFNAAHTVSYGMIGWMTMWFKQHETSLFFQETLRREKIKGDNSKQDAKDADKVRRLLRDAVRGHEPRKPIQVLAPNPRKSGITWSRSSGALQAGITQIPGIGESKARAIVDSGVEIDTWDDLIKVKGFGPKTVANIVEYTGREDPMKAYWLDRTIAQVKQEIRDGKLGTIPRPTHVAADIPHDRGQDLDVTWLGVIHQRNVRDLFEFNQAKGKELDPEKVKDPHLSEWMVMVGDDESDQMGLRVDRWLYPKLRKALWDMRLGQDLLLVQGIKPGFMPTRQIWVKRMWVIDPE